MIVDYCASKFAVRGMSQALISELEYLGLKNIKVSK